MANDRSELCYVEQDKTLLYYGFWAVVVMVLSAGFVVMTQFIDRGSDVIPRNDPVYYYSYVRSLVIDNDLNFANEYDYFGQGYTTSPETGLPVNKFSIGFPLMVLPFYVLTHLVMYLLKSAGAGVGVDGFSNIYQLSFCMTSIAYGYMGLIVSFRFLKRFFTAQTSFIAITAILLASNILYYFMREPFMSHLVSFFTVSLFISSWHTISEGRARSKEYLVIGASAALMIMTRQQNAAFLAIPAIDAVVRYFRKEKAFPWFLRLRNAGLFLTTFIPLISLQLLVWIVLLGSPFTYSYGGETFAYAASPKLIEVLFSTKHGLVSWNPIIGFAIVGLAAFVFTDKLVGALLSVGFLMQLYTAASWWNWWFGASFGHRAFINCTIIFAMGLAALIERLRVKKGVLWVVVPMGILFIWNLLMIAAYLSEIIPYEDYFCWRDLFIGLADLPKAILRKINALSP